MVQFLNAKLISAVIFITVTMLLGYGIYHRGYQNAETHYQKLLTEFSSKAEKLRTIEDRVTKETVTQYRDRIEVVTEKETTLLSLTDEQLAKESLDCSIGPNFIKLHNEAAIQ